MDDMTDRWADVKDGRSGGWTNKLTHRQINRQTGKETEKQTAWGCVVGDATFIIRERNILTLRKFPDSARLSFW
jgi:hypothetical protein